MEIKWTPWRGEYIKGGDKPDEGCVLCHVHEAQRDAEMLLLHRGTHAFVMLNLFPYNPGHLMVVPYAHTAEFAALDTETASEIMQLSQRCVAVLQAEMNPHGYNLGMNLGRVSGAGVDQHVHMHVVPRWNGDTNFMPVLAGTSVVPEALKEIAARLRKALAPGV